MFPGYPMITVLTLLLVHKKKRTREHANSTNPEVLVDNVPVNL